MSAALIITAPVNMFRGVRVRVRDRVRVRVRIRVRVWVRMHLDRIPVVELMDQ